MVSAGVRLPGASRKQGKGGTTVTEKELRKLNRAELLEMLIAQSKKLNRVEEELLAAQKELERRKIAMPGRPPQRCRLASAPPLPVSRRW